MCGHFIHFGNFYKLTFYSLFCLLSAHTHCHEYFAWIISDVCYTTLREIHQNPRHLSWVCSTLQIPQVNQQKKGRGTWLSLQMAFQIRSRYFISVTSNSKLGDQAQVSKRAKMVASPTLGFSKKEDKVGAFQRHDDALVVTLRIGGYDVKKDLVD